MKKFTIIMTVLIATATTTNAQWQQTNCPHSGRVNCFTVNGTNIFVGIENEGVLLSTDNGVNWTAINTGITNTGVRSLVFSGTDIFAGTDTSGVWKRSLSEIIGIEDATSATSTISVYPNPASEMFTLNIIRSSNEALTLNIYNVIGVLVKSEMLKQNNRQINVGELSNGIYMVEIKTKEWTEKQKLIIQR